MALWFEHLNYIDNSFLHPESLECIRKINHSADENWNVYTTVILEEDLQGHLLPYPVHISNNGEITTMTGFEFFPDTKARPVQTRNRSESSVDESGWGQQFPHQQEHKMRFPPRYDLEIQQGKQTGFSPAHIHQTRTPSA
ncbi:Phospholipase D [Forsythia ovata]|uniref:Phospholipase D n=1 Tax=Forsythia ovata TaxID=205694 RepID=A0ABD1WUG1_9LAMI